MFGAFCFFALAAVVLAAANARYHLGNCDEKNMVTFNKIEVSPHPIMFPGKLNIDVDVTLNSELGGSVDVDISLKKKVAFIPIPIPCVSGVGSCTYKDICSLLEGQKCPSEVSGQDIPCSCPFKSGRYTFKMDNLVVPEIPSSISWLATGKYEAEARILQNGSQIGCVRVEVELDKPCTGWFCGK